MNYKYFKKMVAVIGAITLVGSTLSGCGSKTSKEEALNLSVVAGSMSASSPTGIGVQALVDKVNELGGDTLKAEAFFDTQLGDAKSMVQGLQQGTIDIGVAGNSYFSSIVPEVQVLELPYLFADYEEARKICDGEVGRELLGLFEAKGLVGLNFWEIGFRQLTNNTRPVMNVADVKGMKMRTLTAPVQVKLWETYGALPTAIDSSELYASLQQGMVVSQENPISEIVSKKFYEVQKYMSMTNHVYTPMVLGMSKTTYDKLSEEQKEILSKGVEAGTQAAREATDKAEMEGLEILKNAGMEIEENPNVDEFAEVGKAAYSVFVDVNGDEYINKIEAAK